MKKNKLPVVECSRSECIETTCKIFILLLSLFLISCKSTKVAEESPKKTEPAKLRSVYITNTKKVELLPPSAAGEVFEGLQLLNGSFGQQSFNLLSYTQIDARGISLSLMNDFGTDMGNLFYDGEQVIFDSAYFPKALPGEYIICDIQNAFYNLEALKENYEKAALTFEEWPAAVDKNSGGQGKIRHITDGKKLIEEIQINHDTITIKNYLRGYEYKLTKLEE